MLRIFAIAAAALMIAPVASPAAEPGVLTARQNARCAKLDANFARTGKILKLYRAYTGADGESKIQTIDMEGQGGVYYGGKVSLTQWDFGDPTKAVVVYGHPNMEIPPHPSPYREIFLIVSGSSVVTLADGTEYRLFPGSMLLSEDQNAKGRGGRSGPCGYVAIDFQYKDAPKQ